jgi:hypothetical protein
MRSAPIGERDAGDDTSVTTWQGGMNLTYADNVVPGQHIYRIECNQTEGDIEYMNNSISVLELYQD